MTILLFLLGFVVLVVGANALVDGASSLGKRLGLSDMVIGLTIVAMGTSLPELIINVFASSYGNTDLAISNILGSNIFNILMVLGLAAAIRPLATLPSTVNRDIPTVLIATFLLGILVHDSVLSPGYTDKLGRIEGVVFLAGMAVYLWISFRDSNKYPEEKPSTGRVKPIGISLIFIALGLAGLYFGGNWIVKGVGEVAGALGIGESEAGLTIVATATSLPELVTSVIAAIRNKSDMALGNAIGSCIFNIFLILGISSVIHPLPFGGESLGDLLMTLFASFLMFVFIFTGKGRVISRLEGILMLVIYVVFLWFRLAG